LPANIVVVPLMSVLLPLAIGTALLSYAGPWIAYIPRCITALLLHSVSASVFTLAHFRASDLRVADPSLWAATFCLASLALAITVARKHRAFIAVSLLLLAFGDVLVLRPRRPQVVANALEITAIDVGQGDSLLVVTPEGKTLLIDGGGTLGTQTSFDTGEDVVSPYLWARGFSHLDAVALTHAHGDHIGGLPSVLNNFRPAELWVAPSPLTAAYTALIAQAHRQSMAVSTRVAGDNFTFGGANFEVLAPAADSTSNIRRGNDESMVLKVSYRDTSALLEGDAEKKTERLIAPELTQVNVLKVAHHGSATSTIPALLESAHPQFAMISVGRFNRYGHPRADVLSHLSEAGTCVFRTDLSGALSFYLDGTRVTAARWGREAAAIQFPSRWIPRQTAGHCAAVR
jgi:competence protein ComEC